MNSVVQTTAFVAPHFIEQLGCEGLTSEEIALAINTEHRFVRNNVEQLLQEQDDLSGETARIQTYREEGGKRLSGRPRVSYVLSTRAARKVVMLYRNNPIAEAFREHLLDCEETVREDLPKLKEAVAALMAENESLKAELARRQANIFPAPLANPALPKPKLIHVRMYDQLLLDGVISHKTHFGLVAVETLTPHQQHEALRDWNHCVAAGAMRAAARHQDAMNTLSPRSVHA